MVERTPEDLGITGKQIELAYAGHLLDVVGGRPPRIPAVVTCDGPRLVSGLAMLADGRMQAVLWHTKPVEEWLRSNPGRAPLNAASDCLDGGYADLLVEVDGTLRVVMARNRARLVRWDTKEGEQ
jgi:hypothetical protein